MDGYRVVHRQGGRHAVALVSVEAEVEPVGARLEAVSFDVGDARAAATFWATLLGRDVVAETGSLLVPGDGTQVGLRFVTSRTPRSGRPRLHVHLTSSSPEDQRGTVARALGLGARHHDVGQSGDEGFVVLADPEGVELCVIEPGNGWLAGTGRLGEITGDGTRAVGLFWRDVLGWPLVWDQDGQTAVQSPEGGTKIAWDEADDGSGDSRGPAGQERFDLVCDSVDDEVERLVSLGAGRLDRAGDQVRLTDPDGYAFTLRLG